MLVLLVNSEARTTSWWKVLPRPGALALWLLLLALATGTLLAFVTPALAQPLQWVELTSLTGRLARATHSWSGRLLVLVLLWRLLGRMLRRQGLLALFLRALALLTAVALVLSGHWLREASASQTVLLHHGVTLTLLVSLLVLVTLRWRGMGVALPYAVLTPFALGLLFPPSLPGGTPAARSYASQRSVPLFRPLSFSTLDPSQVPTITGGREGCVGCHSNVQGFSAFHDPRAVGCTVCHLGRPFRADAEGAHDGILLVPGNLDSASQTCGRCHEEKVRRMQGAIMARAPGIVSVDRFIFGEQAAPRGLTAIFEVAHSPADDHLRQQCAPCHLAYPKDAPAPTNELSRGGGCTACHLAEIAPRPNLKEHPGSFMHPNLSIQVGNENCFGCHSRSGRISLSYGGWWESSEGPKALADGRKLSAASADVHFEKGLACIDCHTAQETMGDGVLHEHQEQASHVRCTSCHRTLPAREVLAARLPTEAGLIVALRGQSARTPSYLVEDRSGEVLTNVRALADGSTELTGKLDGAKHLARPPAKDCRELEGHKRLSCQSCHSAWAPRCIGCHTQFDASSEGYDALARKKQIGAWVEYDVEPAIAPPSLGVVQADKEALIEPFVPGMVLTINGPDVPSPKPLPESSASLIGPRSRFVRAYARSVPHTTTRKGRDCASCHLEPRALGVGEGRLLLVDAPGAPRWKFEPAYEPSPFDRLPKDAWVGFLEPAPDAVSTRVGQRPLSVDEQRRVLRVGACLGCHEPNSAGGRALYQQFEQSLSKQTARCRDPH